MTGLPSYHEATARPDWLNLIASYVAFSDYHALCLVSRRSWSVFAPRLWGNLFRSVRKAGLDPSDDLAWWFDLVFNRLRSNRIRLETRKLVRGLDARSFAKDAHDFSSDQNERTLQQSFKQALAWLPNVDSLLLDGHVDLDPSFLIGSHLDQNQDTSGPLLLSVAYCPHQLPNNVFSSPSIQGLVYLDITGVPGSIAPLCHSPAHVLPDLRVLKLRGRELGSQDFGYLVSHFKLRLWCLDISDNNVRDHAVEYMTKFCFPKTTLRSAAHFEREGKLEVDSKRKTLQVGSFIRIIESEDSAKFDHPERYLPDAPMYHANPFDGPQEYHVLRSDGLRLIREDSVDTASAVLSEDATAVEDYRSAHGLTHLHLSNNQITAEGLSRLVCTSNGQIENLSCDDMPLLPASEHQGVWPAYADIRGIIGHAHIFRPVISSNLTVLRIHHSLATHIPSLEHENLSTLARIHISENIILPRIKSLFSQTFIPDMNPRLTSMTLTKIPRRSTGPLITSLIAFLRLLSEQERSVQDHTPVSSSWRSPRLLKGLRHLRLEFEPDPMQEGFSASEDLDAEELMASGDQGFSFFGNEWTGAGGVRVAPAAEQRSDMRHDENSSAGDHNAESSYSVRDDEEYMTYHGEWNGETFDVPVWIGKSPSTNPVLQDYRNLVTQHAIKDSVAPATPAQVQAGAPKDSYIYQKAWMLAVMPQRLDAPPTKELLRMKDVLAEVKAYRLRGRAMFADLKQKRRDGARPTRLGEPHFFWTGKLEVSVEEPATHSRPSQYWR